LICQEIVVILPKITLSIYRLNNPLTHTFISHNTSSYVFVQIKKSDMLYTQGVIYIMRRIILLSLLLLLSMPLMLAPIQSQTVTEHHITLYLEDFTNVTENQPTDLPSPITFGPNRANFFTNPNLDWITLQIGHTAPAEAVTSVALATALKDEVLTADGNLGHTTSTGYTSWRSPDTGAPINSQGGGVGNPPTTNDGKVEILIEPHKLLGTSIFQVADIADIRWQTYRVADSSGGNDWYASIWTNTPTQSTNGNAVGGGYTALINFEGRYTDPPLSTGDWIQNSASNLYASEHFYAVTKISGVTGVTLPTLTSGAINWSNYPNPGPNVTNGDIDYRNHDVKAIAFATASSWGHALDSYLDDLQIDIETSPGNIERIIINLETRAPVYSSNPPEDSIINITTSVGVEATAPITIENIGTQPLSLTNISLNNPAVLEIGHNATSGAPISPSGTFDFNFLCGGASHTTPGTYTNTVNVTHDGLGASSPAEYTVNCEITADFTIDSAQSTSGALVNGATFNAQQDTISITFTADVFNTTDPADPNYADSASNPANYVLLQGDTIATNACNAINPSDTQITAFTVNYDSASRTSTLTFNPALSDGTYRLLVCGTTSIVSAIAPNVSLNGGTDVTFNFTIDTTVPVTPTAVVSVTPAPTVTPSPDGTGQTGTTPAQPEDLGVTSLPDTGDTPAWADLLRQILGW
jgi:hypothetical protein